MLSFLMLKKKKIEKKFYDTQDNFSSFSVAQESQKTVYNAVYNGCTSLRIYINVTYK